MHWKSGIPRFRQVVRLAPVLAFVGLPLATITAVAATAVPVTGTALPGTLTAIYPAAIALNTGTAGLAVNTALNITGGAILVTDTRGAGSCGTWSTTATLSDFTQVGGAATIPSSSVSVTPGSVLASLTNPVGAVATAGGGGAFTNPSTAGSPTNVSFMSASGLGCGIFGLNPTFAWTVPANATAAGGGTAYTATMTFTTQ